MADESLEFALGFDSHFCMHQPTPRKVYYGTNSSKKVDTKKPHILRNDRSDYLPKPLTHSTLISASGTKRTIEKKSQSESNNLS